MSKHSGFTLIEIVVVLAVVGALMAAMAPMAFTYINDSRNKQAQNDVNQIAAAVGRFIQDTALLPYKNINATVKVNAKQTANPDFDCLYGSQGGVATDSTSGSWTTSGVHCDSGTTRDTIDNHLIKNTPNSDSARAYATTGQNAWRGPYLPSVVADPWGNAYLINVGKGDPSAATKKAVWAISAGPNGKLETNADAARASIVTAGGDDLVARIQ